MGEPNGIPIKALKSGCKPSPWGYPKFIYKDEIYLPYYDKGIKVRDTFKCMICGVKPLERLSIHHIDEDKKNNSPRNLICLCSSCHEKIYKRGISKDLLKKYVDSWVLQVSIPLSKDNMERIYFQFSVYGSPLMESKERIKDIVIQISIEIMKLLHDNREFKDISVENIVKGWELKCMSPWELD
jgi:hypothetical protein